MHTFAVLRACVEQAHSQQGNYA